MTRIGSHDPWDGARPAVAGPGAGRSRRYSRPRTGGERCRAPRRSQPRSRAVTVSGLSSGGFFAHQFHVAYSELVAGAGIVAGGPYACVETIANPYWPLATLDRLSAALVACTATGAIATGACALSAPDASDSVALIEAPSARRHRRPRSLSGDRVWLFRGELDDLVPEASSRRSKASTGTGDRGARPRESIATAAGHGMPVSEFPDDSRFRRPPARSTSRRSSSSAASTPPSSCCAISTPSLAVPADAPADAHDAGTLMAFDQTRFFDPQDKQFAAAGYVYVPDICRTQRCRLHVAFHGCRQTIEAVHDDFVRDAGYNGWAAAGRHRRALSPGRGLARQSERLLGLLGLQRR
jgi:hypothetical protein